MGAQGQNHEAMLLGFIHHANQEEIELANLAKDNSSSTQVKSFADRMIKDHKSADDQIIALAKTKNIDLTAMPKEHAMKDTAGSEASSHPTGTATGDHARMAESGTGGGIHDMAQHKADLDKLRGLKGAEFDREYVRIMVNDHQKVVDKLITARSRITDPDTTKLVDQLLPELKEHLAAGQKLQGSCNRSI